MEIQIEQQQGRVPVTIMKLMGDLDGSNYQDVITKGKELVAAGTTHLLIDMKDVPFMGSAGLVALHSLALALQGKPETDPEEGWNALHAARIDAAQGKQAFVKILNPQPSVLRGLERTGMTELFEVHTDLATAVAAFA